MKSTKLKIFIGLAATVIVTGCGPRGSMTLAEKHQSVADMEKETLVQSATLQCKAHEEECFCFYSFTTGVLTPPLDSDQVDILYYFDGDDCSQGALFGHDDQPGYLFPIGQKSWSELLMLKPPAKDMESVVGIMPLTKDKEGLAFWVKARGGEYILARIRAVQPTSYSDLVSGSTASLELEWSRLR